MFFPLPIRWKQLAAVDPERNYVAFTSRFVMKSRFRALRFPARSGQVQRQVDTAPGIVGWSLAANLFKLQFYTLSAWEDVDSLRRFARSDPHRAAMQEFSRDRHRKSVSVQYTVRGRDLPLTWKEALRRQRAVAEDHPVHMNKDADAAKTS